MKALLWTLIWLMPTAAATADWLQWGGPNRDFTVAESAPLSDAWPESGPEILWEHPLGAGFSSVLVADKTVYTAYHREQDDVVVALDADTGETLWETAVAVDPSQPRPMGPGPNATPIIVGAEIYTVSYTGVVHCLDRRTGELKWERDLVADFGAKVHQFGYSSSPIHYRDMVIFLTGGEQGAVGLDPADGSLRWRSEALDTSYGSPTVLEFEGDSYLVFMTSSGVVGVSLDDGRIRWREELEQTGGNNCSGPWVGDDGLIVISSQAESGSRTLRLRREGDEIRLEEVAHNDKLLVFPNTGVRLEDWLYAASGPFLIAHNLRTGENAWVERGFPKANAVFADGKLILLDETGKLTLARATPEKLTVLSSVTLMSRPAWTVPTLDGTRLYLRDQQRILALDLAVPESVETSVTVSP